jgi:hypothetical protein
MAACLLFLFVLVNNLSASEPVNPETVDLSIINLISTPQQYHNRKIGLVGYVIIEFEGHAVYLSGNDAEHMLTRNALWLDLDDAEFSKYQKLSREYVLIEGVFDATIHGHGALYSGAIREISRFQKQWIKRK